MSVFETLMLVSENNIGLAIFFIIVQDCLCKQGTREDPVQNPTGHHA